MADVLHIWDEDQNDESMEGEQRSRDASPNDRGAVNRRRGGRRNDRGAGIRRPNDRGARNRRQGGRHNDRGPVNRRREGRDAREHLENRRHEARDQRRGRHQNQARHPNQARFWRRRVQGRHQGDSGDSRRARAFDGNRYHPWQRGQSNARKTY